MWDLFQEIICKARSLCKQLTCLRTVSGLVQEVDMSLDSMQTKQVRNPTKDYSATMLPICKNLTELKETLRGSNIPAGHNLWSVAKDLSERLQDLQAKEVALTPRISSRLHLKPTRELQLTSLTSVGRSKTGTHCGCSSRRQSMNLNGWQMVLNSSTWGRPWMILPSKGC